MRGRFGAPEGEGPFPAVLIAHEANGLDEFQAGRAEVFSELGYHGEGRVFDDPGQMMGQLEAVGSKPDEIRARARAALDAHLAEP